jgi:putative NIF3 family GTP cyclohydrolase 1 type 2
MKMKVLFLILLSIPLFSLSQKSQPKTPADVVALIKKQVTCNWSNKTVDTFKAGDPNSRLSGIAVCMFADMQTLKAAVKNNCNFIITHEPVFYNHTDETSAYTSDPVYQQKAKFIQDNKLVIFRFHDHIHRTNPDGIYEGMINRFGWKKNSVNDSHIYFQFNETSLEAFAKELKVKLGMNSIRIIGNPEMKFTKVGLAVGAPGGSSHIRLLNDSQVEVLVAGEAPEWETYLYANDAVAQGKNKAVIFLGHIKSEEAGMEYCAQWLQHL